MALLQVYSGLQYPTLNGGQGGSLNGGAVGSAVAYAGQGINQPYTDASRFYNNGNVGVDGKLATANTIGYYNPVGPSQVNFAAGGSQWQTFAPNKYSYFIDGRGNNGNFLQPTSQNLINRLLPGAGMSGPDTAAFAGNSLFYDYFNQYFVKQSTLYGNADNITQLGYDFYWLAFGFHLVAMIVFGYLTVFHGKESRRLHVLTVAIAVTGAAVYYALARAQGGVALPNDANTGFRVFYWARYVQWAATTPALVYVLGLLAGASIEAIVAGVVSALIFVATRLFGALSANSSRWGWFSFACGAQLVLFGILFAYFRPAAYRKSDSRGYATTIALFFMLAAWFPYLTIWVIGEGTRAVTVDSEILLYAIFDVYKQLVFCAVVLFSEPIYGLLSTTSADILESKL
eukprot:tig00020553_g10775.t1